MHETTSRRTFLSHSSRLATGAAAFTALAPVHCFGEASKATIRLGIIGCGGIMGQHVNGLIDRKAEVSFAWLCDVDPRQMEAKAKRISEFQRETPQQTARYEDVLADKNTDAVIVATPHHWHAPITLAALAAGKDVYVEKPISHVYDEGAQVIAAANKYDRVVQHGSQMRSSPVTLQAAKLLADGILGEVKVARAWTAEKREVVAPIPDSPVPAGVDYDRWLGPAPVRPYNRHRFHGSWRAFRDYGNGEIGDDGIHDLDMARWGLGDPELPARITARGSRMMSPGHFGDYPDNMHVIYEYPNGQQLIYENYPFTEYGLHGFDNGNVFYGTEGYMVFSRRGAFTVYLGKKGEQGPTERKETRSNRGYAEHMDDFLTAVRNRTTTRSSPSIANASCALVHLGEIANRTRGRLDFDIEKEQFVDCDEANAMLTKEYRAPYTIG